MTTPERSVEEMIRKYSFKTMKRQEGLGTVSEYPVVAISVRDVDKILKAERQRCEEMVGQIRLLIAKYAKEDDMDVSGLVNEINALCK